MICKVRAQFVLGMSGQWGPVMMSVFESQDAACVSGLWQASQEKACFGSPVSLCLNHTGLLTVLIWYSQLVKGPFPNLSPNNLSFITKEGLTKVRVP